MFKFLHVLSNSESKLDAHLVTLCRQLDEFWRSLLAALSTSPDLLSPPSVSPVSCPLPRVFPPSISFLDVPFSFFPPHMPASSPSPDHLLSSHFFFLQLRLIRFSPAVSAPALPCGFNVVAS